MSCCRVRGSDGASSRDSKGRSRSSRRGSCSIAHGIPSSLCTRSTYRSHLSWRPRALSSGRSCRLSSHGRCRSNSLTYSHRSPVQKRSCFHYHLVKNNHQDHPVNNHTHQGRVHALKKHQLQPAPRHAIRWSLTFTCMRNNIREPLVHHSWN